MYQQDEQIDPGVRDLAQEGALVRDAAAIDVTAVRRRAMCGGQVTQPEYRAMCADNDRIIAEGREQLRGALERHDRPLVLMTAQNPGGWKLEELLRQLRAEIQLKNERLVFDDGEVALAVKDANLRIMAVLFEAEGLQRRILAVLDSLRTDEGPLGRPRIGVGSLS